MMNKILPCPLCKGEYPLLHPKKRTKTKGWIYAGAGSSSSDEVGCHRCHVKVVEEHPIYFPKSMPKGLGTDGMLNYMRKHCLAKAIKRWNRLPRK